MKLFKNLTKEEIDLISVDGLKALYKKNKN